MEVLFMKYDILIIGAGPSGAFTAYEIIKNKPNAKILMIEKGRPIEKRICPKRDTNVCVNCKPSCRITTGFSGAGAFSDGKLSLSTDVGGTLDEIVGKTKAQDLINYVDSIYLSFGATKEVYGEHQTPEIQAIRKAAIEHDLKLIDCPIRHLGTEESYKIYKKLQDHLIDSGVTILFDTSVLDIEKDPETGNITKIITENLRTNTNQTFEATYVVSAVGREGSQWFKSICDEHDIKTKVGTVDVGVRVEVRDEIMKHLNENLYESKLIYYTKKFDDKVRVFCSNPSGEVSTEYYDDGLAVVNGHAYKSKDLKTQNTNFALLVSFDMTEPFNDPIAYGKNIAKLGNQLAGNKILVQRYGDFKRFRRTTDERLYRNNIVPTLKDAIPGDLSLVLPYRVMSDLDEMIQALDGIAPGMASDETLLYGVEVKFYSNKVCINESCQTSIENLYAIGDGAGITRGLSQASAMGAYLGDILSHLI